MTKQVNKYAIQVKEFNDTFCPDATITIYQKLIREEFNELVDEIESGESTQKELKELCDLLYVVYGFAHVSGFPIQKTTKEIEEIIDSITKNKSKYPNINLPFVIIATAYVELITSNYDFMWVYRLVQGIHAYAKIKGWPLEQAFSRVHKSNMSKLTIEGKVLRREDGKVLKSDQYKQAQLGDLVNGSKVAAKQKRLKGISNKPPIRSTGQ